MKLTIAVFVLLALATVYASCPNSCSGHGICGASDRCSCFDNWESADCSQRTCPFGLAFSDAPSDENEAHSYAECSGKGICNRKEGQCECYPGYVGKACRRTSCPDDCSGHGTCYFIDEIITENGRNIVNWENKEVYTLWDTQKSQACVCDPYYEGSNCANRVCPKGDDVLTTGQADAIQEIYISDGGVDADVTGQFTITMTDLYGGLWETRPITFDSSADNTFGIRKALEALPNHVIETVTVKALSTSAITNAAVTNGAAYSITFDNAHNSGNQNVMVVNWTGCPFDGCQPIYAGLGTSAADQPISVQVAITTVGTQERAACSDHGLCDSETGLCECFEGFFDEDCHVQTVLV